MSGDPTLDALRVVSSRLHGRARSLFQLEERMRKDDRHDEAGEYCLQRLASLNCAADCDAVIEDHIATKEAAKPTHPLLDIVIQAELMAEQIPRWAEQREAAPDRRKCTDNYILDLCEQVAVLSAALADAATEAECGHEMGGLAETILNRHGLRELREYVIGRGPDTDPEPF